MLQRGRKGKLAREVEDFRRTQNKPVLVVHKNGAPPHLGKDGSRLFTEMVASYQIEDAGRIAVLTRAAECIDRMAAARKSIEKSGVVIETESGALRANPAVAIEKDARNGFYSAVRLLDLDARATARDDTQLVPWGR